MIVQPNLRVWLLVILNTYSFNPAAITQVGVGMHSLQYHPRFQVPDLGNCRLPKARFQLGIIASFIPLKLLCIILNLLQ